MERLEGRVAVVTGGGSGIGEALCLACAEAGMDVAVADIEEQKAQAVADAVRQRGRRSLAARCDVSDLAKLEALADRAWDEFGGVHLLCNNAGVLMMGALQEKDARDWSWVFGVNVFGMAHGVQAFVPRMIEQAEGGHVLNTCSIAGLVGAPGNGVYNASKQAALALSETLRADLEPHGIGVSALCPSGVSTRIVDAGRNRPKAHGQGGIAREDMDRVGSFGNEANRTPIEASRAAELALDAVRRNELYVITHPGTKPMVEERFAAILSAHDRAARRHPDLP